MVLGVYRLNAIRVLLLAAIVFIGAQIGRADDTIRYENGRWFDGTHFVEKTVYVTKGEFSSQLSGPSHRIVDLKGGYVVPAFGDAHTHALASMPHHASEINAMMRQNQIDAWIRQGVFYIANPNSIATLTAQVRPYVNIPGSVVAIFSNGGMTGSGGHPMQFYGEDMRGQAYHVIDSEADLERAWPLVLAGTPDFIKVYLEVSEEHTSRRVDAAYYGKRGLDPKLLPAVVSQAHAAHLRVVAHVASQADVLVALESKVDAIAHLPLERLTSAIAQKATRQQTVFMTTVTSHRPTTHITDIEAVHRFNLRLLHQYDVPLVLGTDNLLSGILHEAEEVKRLGGFSTVEVLNLLTQATPRWIVPRRHIGVLSAGYEATFVVLKRNPLAGLGALRDIALWVQQGNLLDIAD